MNFLSVGDRPKVKTNGHWGLIAVLAAALLSMTAMSLEQARVIEGQRGLIRQLFQDSMQLGALRLQHQAPRHSH